jgi:hypothetical protein
VSEKFERITEWEPAFDRRSSNPKKNYGIHGVSMRWVLKGSKGAIQFVVYTQWMLPHVYQEQIEKFKLVCATEPDKIEMDLKIFWQPMAADLGYHSKVPMYDGQEVMGAYEYKLKVDETMEGFERFEHVCTPTGTFTPCPYLDGAPCYYDGSGLQAERVLEILIEKGGEAVWQYMEECYHSRFNEVEVVQ